jgi:hypothetical protein
MLCALSPNIFTRPDGGSARSARPRLMEAIMVDRTAAAAAEIDRHNATEADKDNAFKLFTPWTADKAKSTDEIATLRQKLAAEDKAQSTPNDRTADAGSEIATLRQKWAAAEARIQEKAKSTPTLDGPRERMAALLRDLPTLDAAARTRPATAQAMHGRAAESVNAAPERPRLVAVFIAGELGFVGMA